MNKSNKDCINIAKILDNKTVVIDKGADNGITSSTRFSIYSDYGTITDHTTGKDLGKLEVIKGYAHVYDLKPNMTVLTSDGPLFYERAVSSNPKAIIRNEYANPLFNRQKKKASFDKEVEYEDKVKIISN